MNTPSEPFFEVVLDLTRETVVVVQAANEMTAWNRAMLVQDQLDPARDLRVSAAHVRPAVLPFRAPTFSSGYFAVLEEAQEMRDHTPR